MRWAYSHKFAWFLETTASQSSNFRCMCNLKLPKKINLMEENVRTSLQHARSLNVFNVKLNTLGLLRYLFGIW